MSTASHYAEIRARFFPPTRPIVKATSVYAEREIKAGLAALKQEQIVRAVEKALLQGPGPVDSPLSSMLEIAKEVAKKHGFKTWRELTKRRRAREYVYPRQEAMWRCSRETDQSLPAIGRFFGFDHTTVMHACRVYEARLELAGKLA